MKLKRKSYTKIALTLSIVLLILWSILGTGTSLAWFSDTTPVAKNTFYIGELDLEVSHKVEDTYYEVIDTETSVFDDNALYEPGYVQIVYLKVKNKGEVPFDYKLAVDVNAVDTAFSVLGNEIYLPNYLKYGVVFGDDEATLNRETAKINAATAFPDETAELPLNTYTKKDDVTLQPGEERYIALIVRMPEEVGNAANYRGEDIPSVELGITVTASQAGTLA